MKLKAPSGVGDPCVAGVIIASRDGIYEVEPEIGAILIECFGFVEVAGQGASVAPAPAAASRNARASRRSRPAPKKMP